MQACQPASGDQSGLLRADMLQGNNIPRLVMTRDNDFIYLKHSNWLKSKNVVVKLEQSVDMNAFTDGQKIYQTSNGETIEADCHFLCIGKPLASAWLKETVLKNDLDGQGRIKVDERLRVKGRNNIFAIGDITDIPVSACHY